MALVRLIICVSGVYAMFLLWAIAQERLSVPFETTGGEMPERFNSPQFLSLIQSLLCTLSALSYLLLRRAPGATVTQTLGLAPPSPTSNSTAKTNGTAMSNGSAKHASDPASASRTLLLRYAQCSFSITAAAPFGFAALQHVSYPAMVLAKSCKLVPVMLMNILLYRRAFAPHKYAVVVLVTMGITLFMFFGSESHSKTKSKGSSTEHPSAAHAVLGMIYLLINLALDGTTNSTQDEVFARAPWRVTGQQMMLWINAFSSLTTLLLVLLPLPHIPVLHPGPSFVAEAGQAISFVRTHPGALQPLLAFALCGAVGQLFIFETLEHFGSLTLVTVTLTRKLFTMLLSVVLYNHQLTAGQWAGAATVFAGISIEAWVKRRDVHAKRVLREQEKARIKEL
ncbi:UAA transporter [Vararia minispora EC-137]|uniref:UAA transporter n=1 Tax=Vararia minispora EC-137 TaxID=1314806 RepID=A0ACB8QJI8_9AGAM|nr:UAA transporter [Vararia minispora EC-137]